MKLFSKLNFIRVFRLVSGLALLIYGLSSHQPLWLLIGGVVTLLGILNVGCPFNSCGVPSSEVPSKKKEIEYEDV